MFNSSESICNYYPLGSPALGLMTDWVIHSMLAFGQPTGWVQIWRNGQLMVDAANILTAYDDVNPPYMKIGSYVVDWRLQEPTGYTWSSASYTTLRFGNGSASYDEVYTGHGAACGSYCDLPSTDDDSYELLDQTAIVVIVAPLASICLCSLVLYFAHIQQRTAYEDGKVVRKGARRKTASAEDMSSRSSARTESHERPSFFEKTANTLSRSSLGALIWEEEVEFLDVRDQKHAAQDGDIWRSGTTRMVLWYCFGYSVVFVMLLIALVLYGRPVAHKQGLIQWSYIHSWGDYQATMIAISTVMMTIYFLPLLFIRHDFEAGRAFVNDPKFLKRIGVVIPCHKSAAEIGEVVRRVLWYIPPENVIVCDNGNFDSPSDNTFEVVKAVHPKIQYCFIKQGHKTRALWTGAHRLPGHVEYIMHLDDDTHLSEHMVFDENHFLSKKNKDHVISVAFLRSSAKINAVTEFTDFWYKITDHFHGTQAFIATRSFVPGPAGMTLGCLS